MILRAILSLLILLTVLSGIPAAVPRIAVLGVPPDESGLTPEVTAAYNWAETVYDVQYLSFDDIRRNENVLSGFRALWWHYDASTSLPGEARHPMVTYRIRTYLQRGQGMLLSGFAAQYVVDLGFEDTPPDEVMSDPMTTGAWGFQKELIPHPVFRGLPNTFPTVSSGLAADNNICWWSDANDFDGRWLADTEWNGGIVTAGVYTPDRGRVLVVGAGAFEWHFSGQTNTNKGNLELFTKNLIDYAGAFPDDSVSVWWRFDEEEGKAAREEVLGFGSVVSWRDEAEWTDGVHGNALRFDGNSSSVRQIIGSESLPHNELTVEAWVALKSYPNGTAAFINQHVLPDGYFFGINKYGYWNLSIGSAGEWFTVGSPNPLPKFTWVHVAGTFRSDGLRLFLNGSEVAFVPVNNRTITMRPSQPVEVGKHNQPTFAGIFQKDTLNGLMDEVRVYTRALSSQEIQDHYLYAQPPAIPALGVPPERWENDPHRPRFHAIPPSNWCNEGHGLIYYRGNYHFFYQHNPNGNILEHMHWGHKVSPNLVDWTEYRTPLWPEANGPDYNGCWSGDVVVRGDGATIVYTSNSDAQTQSVAFGGGDLLVNWVKYGGNPVTGAFPPGIPPQDVLGFRDPCLFEANGTTYMAIGSGDAGDGGLVVLYQSDNMVDWNHKGILYSAPIAVAGEMWEMPNFFEIEPGRWVLFINNLPNPTPTYWIGRFENERFIPDNPTPGNLDIGHAYLSPTFARTPNGRMIAMGIIPEDRFADDQKAAGWSNLFGLPREITLQDGFLGQWPAAEISDLRAQRLYSGQNMTITPGASNYLPGVTGNQLDIELTVDPKNSETFGVIVRKSPDSDELTRIGFNRIQDLFVVREESSNLGSVGKWTTGGAHRLGSGENLVLRIIVDRSVLTVFANGRTALTTRIYPSRADSLGVDFYTFQNPATILDVKIWRMRDALQNEEWPSHPTPTMIGPPPTVQPSMFVIY